MKRIAMIFALAGLLSLGAFAQTKDEKDVTAAFETLKKGMLDGDRATLENIAAPQLTYGHSSGVIQDKATFVEAIASGKSDFVTIDVTDYSVKVSGDLAMVRHKLFAKTNDSGVPGSTSLGIFLVFQKQKGAWKLIGRQAYKLPVQ